MSQVFLKDIRRYLTSTAFLTLLNLIRNILISRMLGPTLTGACSSFLVLPQIGQYATLIIISALPVVIPRGDPENPSSLKIRDAVFSYTILVTSALSGLVLIYAFFISELSWEYRFYLASATALIFLFDINKFFTYTYAADREFLKLSWLEFLFALLFLITSLAGVKWLSARGFWLSYIFSNLALLAYCWKDYGKKYKIRFAKFKAGTLLPLASLGLVLLLSAEMANLFTVPAKLFLALTLGVKEVGFFTVAILILSKLSIIPRAISTVITPHVSSLFHSSRNQGDIYQIFIRSQAINLASTALIIFAGYFCVGTAIRLILPDFAPAIPMAKMILLAGIPFSLIMNANQILITSGKNRHYTFFLLLSLFIQFSLFGFFYFTRFSSINLAMSYVIVFSIYCLMVNASVIKLLKKGEASLALPA